MRRAHHLNAVLMPWGANKPSTRLRQAEVAGTAGWLSEVWGELLGRKMHLTHVPKRMYFSHFLILRMVVVMKRDSGITDGWGKYEILLCLASVSSNVFTGQTRSPAFSYNHVSVSCVLFHICGWIRPVFHSDCLNSTADLCDTIYIYMYMIGVWCVYIQIDRVICRQPKVWQASRRKMRSGQTSQTKKPHQTMSQRSFSLKAQPNRRDGAQDLSKQIYRNVIKCKYTHAWRYSYI